jgi:AcrR family transcriptional regulator
MFDTTSYQPVSLHIDTSSGREAGVVDVVRPYRGVSAAERRAERRSRIKSACLDVVGRDGVVAVTVDGVCARAGLTKRYFYEGFADLDALFGELIDEVFDGLLVEIRAALAGQGPQVHERARMIATCLIEYLRRDRRVARLYVEAPGQPTLRARRERAYQTYTRLLLDELPAASACGDDEASGRARRSVAALILVAGVTQAVVSWLQGEIELDRTEIIDELTRVMVAALTTARSEEPT